MGDSEEAEKVRNLGNIVIGKYEDLSGVALILGGCCVVKRFMDVVFGASGAGGFSCFSLAPPAGFQFEKRPSKTLNVCF